MTSIVDHKVSVVMLTMSFQPSLMGGAEIQALRLARALKEKGLEVSFVTLGQKGQSKRDTFEGMDVFRIRLVLSPFFYSNRSGSKSDRVQLTYQKNDKRNFEISGRKSPLSLLNYLIFFLNAYFYLRTKRFTHIYVPTIEWLAFVGALLGKFLDRKVVVKDSTMNGLTNLLRYPFGGYMRKVICAHAYFVAMTNAIRISFGDAGIPAGRIYQIPNGIELPTLYKRTVKPNKFVFVGNLSQQPAKGVDILLNAWVLVVREIPDAQLFIIGDGHLPAYIAHVGKLGISDHVHFMGKLAQFQNHLTESMAFILPSRREGMSNALLEAMALGVTCIATDISGSQDLIEHNVNGLLVPPEDETALAEAVKYVHLNQDKAIAMGLEARRTIENGFTLGSVSDRYCRLFLSISN